jgi:uncharacterized membrane protein (DUF373 family)
MDGERSAGYVERAGRTMHMGELVVYGGIAVLLFASALVALGSTAYHLVRDLDSGALSSVTAALDGVLLVFILVELLGATKTTVSEGKLLAEPFLIVGIIASIKEIVVSSLKAAKAEGDAFDDIVTKIGILGGVVLLLALSSWLVRRKEREPPEE